MKVKKYEAANMQEALIKVKADLGADAVILHSKKIIKGGIFGLFGKERIEILAASESLPPADISISQDIQEKFHILQSELKEVKSFIHTLLKQVRQGSTAPHFPEQYEDWFLKLLQNEVDEKLAQRIIKEVQEECPKPQDANLIRTTVIQKIVKIFGDPKPIILKEKEQKIVALIGPTGVGKTTTIAKLAAIFNIRYRKKVALLTADTYRIAAIDQLKRYAEIMKIPLEIAFTPEELRDGIKKHFDKDLILIDTAGRSQKDIKKVNELKDFMDEAKPSEIHLVLSATTKYKDLLDIFEKFSQIPINVLLFTKLDETTNFGGILNTISTLNKSISYVTTGQNVPEDIEIVKPEKLAKLIIGEIPNA